MEQYAAMKDESKQALEALGMDLSQTLARFVGNEALLFRFLNRFPDDPTFEKLVTAMDAGDSEDAFHQAHTLKGVVGNLGIGDLFVAVDPMVEDLRAGRMEEARAVFPQVKTLYDQAVETIRSLDEG